MGIHSAEDFFISEKMVALPKVVDCCGCASLQSGTIIIGCLNLVIYVICMIVCIGLMIGTDDMVDVFKPMFDKNMPNWEEYMDPSFISKAIVIDASTSLIIFILATVVSSCLIHGAKMGNICLLKPWIILTALGLILNIINIFKAFVGLEIVAGIASIISWIIGTYLFLMVWSFKAKLEDGGAYGGEVHCRKEETDSMKV